MRDDVIELTECTEFRQTLASRPPAIVHGTVLLLTTMLATAVTWAAFAEAKLVVRAPGRVRPKQVPQRVFTPAGTHLDGRVAEVCFSEGTDVADGQVLLRLETKQLDSEISQRQRAIEAAEVEIAKPKGFLP